MKRHGLLLLLLLATVLTFLPSLRNAFINWDDDLYVTENPHIRALSLESLTRVFSNFYAANYQPVTMLSYVLDYHFAGLNPTAFHRTNLLIHLLNCMLLYGFVWLLSRSVFVSLFTALMFGIHPLHVESVAWVSARKDLVSCFFFLGALIVYVLYLKRKIHFLYFFSILFFILSLLAKAMTMILPFLLLLCDYFENKKITKRDVFDKWPHFLIAAFFGMLALYGQHASGAIGYRYLFTFLRNIGFASAAIMFYLAKALAPVQLSCFYTYPRMFPVSYLVLSFIIVICLGGAVIYSLRFTRKLFFGAAFFLVSIFPVLQFIPLGQTTVADRYTYISLIGLFYVMAEAFYWLYKKGKIFIATVFIALIGIFSFLSWNRCSVWADSVTLWNDAVMKSPGQIIPLNNRGEAYYEQGEFDRALTDYNHVIRINPRLAKTYYNRANVFRAQGRFSEAVAQYTRAIELDTRSFDCYNERGITYQLQGDFSKALSDYNEALRLNPRYFQAYINRGILFRGQGKLDKAIADYNQAIRLEPFLGLAYQNRAVAYADLQEYSKAWADIQQALRLGARVPEKFIDDVRKGAQYD